MFKQTLAGLRVLLVFTVLLGVIYPLGIWAVSRIPGLQSNAEGSVVTVNGQAVGSSLIGIDPVAADPAHDPYFHTRPSASASDPLGPGDPSASGGSNKSGFNQDLVAMVQERKTAIAQREGVSPDAVPADAVTASASGLDPDISTAYADLQAARVARNTGLPEPTVKQLIEQHTSGAGIGVPGVNVLELNLAVRAAEAH
ncbi:potassium-transporting ATPase subunit C [Amycolatopsis acidicola]|uniref:Potassium-transporting ATPase KdpC subunit n=1 Tax=Amycolatopsis acidicola TaxID=2596893 RepID=A0A5N0URW2_9PSEU|nr:potassium-transporting ATPase subunit C [Amycolatopsis acidicola]KAA9152053.1 potassium-transporting ATPase subunit C [Amycolatopsis acidicola]